MSEPANAARVVACSALVGDESALLAEMEVEFAKWWGGPVRMELMSCYSGHCAFKAGYLAGRRAKDASSPTVRLSNGGHL